MNSFDKGLIKKRYDPGKHESPEYREQYEYKGLLSRYLEYKRLSMARPWILGDNILDCGCCQAKLLEYAEGNINYVGVDISDGIIDFNKRRYPDKEFCREDLNLLDQKSKFLANNRFNTILLLAVLEHLQNPENIISYLSERLCLNGRLIVTTPHPFSEKIINIGAKFHLFAKEGIEQHQALISGKELIKLAVGVNLRLIKYKRFNLWLNQLFVFEKIAR